MLKGAIIKRILSPDAPDTADISGWTVHYLRVFQTLNQFPNSLSIVWQAIGGGES
jgi:hypothetical protein